MKALPLVALLLTIAGWALTVWTGATLLSGPYEDRTCQTECVQTLFFSGLAAAIAALLVTVIALFRPGGRAVTYGVLVLAAPLAAVYTTVILIGNFA